MGPLWRPPRRSQAVAPENASIRLPASDTMRRPGCTATARRPKLPGAEHREVALRFEQAAEDILSTTIRQLVLALKSAFQHRGSRL